jgi:hypothetical protein
MILPSARINDFGIQAVNPEEWAGSSLIQEASLQQVAPFVGKTKCTMARNLILAFSHEGETVLDPFCGCGVIPFEALVLGRHAIGNDLSPYAYIITRAKLFAPASLREALSLAERYLAKAEVLYDRVDVGDIPRWVASFFHKRTLQEIIALVTLLRAHEQWFLLGCVLGILHHVRPGFLSFPASHLTPYLRKEKYPQDRYPEMYGYRDVRSRLLAKVERMYRRPVVISSLLRRAVLVEDAKSLPIESGSMDAIISSPPYFDALDYGRDNRLRLWFLGVHDYRLLNGSLITRRSSYVEEMTKCLMEMHRVLKPGRWCVLILGDVHKNGTMRRTAEIVADIGGSLPRPFAVEGIVNDSIPDIRRSRRGTQTTVADRILVLRKPR